MTTPTNNTDVLIEKYVSNYYHNHTLYDISWNDYQLWSKNNSKKTIFDYMVVHNFPNPSPESIFRLIPTITSKQVKSFTNYIEYLISKEFDIRTVSKNEQTYSNELNLFEYSVHCAQDKLAVFFHKHKVLPDIENNGFVGVTRILEYGMLDVLKIYKSLGFKGFKKEYGYTGFIHYVALSGSVIETLRTDENLDRGISRLETLKTKFPEYIPKEVSEHDVKILNQGIQYLENMRDDLTSRDKKAATFLYKYINDFTNNQYSNKPVFIKHGANYLLKNDDRNDENNVTNAFWKSYCYLQNNSNMRTYGLIHHFVLSKSTSPFSFINKLDIPAPDNITLREMSSFVTKHPELLKSFTSYLKKVQKQGVNLQLPLVVEERNSYSCFNDFSLLDIAEKYKHKELATALKEIGLTSYATKSKLKLL